MGFFKNGISTVPNVERKWNFLIVPAHSFESSMKEFAIIGISAIIIGAICLVWYNNPKHLASSADYIPEFFGLPSNSVNKVTILDELHSQGKTTFSFGVNHYWLKFQDTREAADAIKEAGGSETDSVWMITKQRGNYIGTFSVSLKDNSGHLRYAEIEE